MRYEDLLAEILASPDYREAYQRRRALPVAPEAAVAAPPRPSVDDFMFGAGAVPDAAPATVAGTGVDTVAYPSELPEESQGWMSWLGDMVIPSDPLGGSDWMLRMRAGAQNDPNEKLRILRSVYGDANVIPIDGGENFRIIENGQARLYNPKGPDIGDIFSITPELVSAGLGTAGAAIGARGGPFGMALGAGAGTALGDWLTREAISGIYGDEQTTGPIDDPVNFGMNFGLGGASPFAAPVMRAGWNAVFSPFKRGAAEFAEAKARGAGTASALGQGIRGAAPSYSRSAAIRSATDDAPEEVLSRMTQGAVPSGVLTKNDANAALARIASGGDPRGLSAADVAGQSGLTDLADLSRASGQLSAQAIKHADEFNTGAARFAQDRGGLAARDLDPTNILDDLSDTVGAGIGRLKSTRDGLYDGVRTTGRADVTDLQDILYSSASGRTRPGSALSPSSGGPTLASETDDLVRSVSVRDRYRPDFTMRTSVGEAPDTARRAGQIDMLNRQAAATETVPKGEILDIYRRAGYVPDLAGGDLALQQNLRTAYQRIIPDVVAIDKKAAPISELLSAARQRYINRSGPDAGSVKDSAVFKGLRNVIDGKSKPTSATTNAIIDMVDDGVLTAQEASRLAQSVIASMGRGAVDRAGNLNAASLSTFLGGVDDAVLSRLYTIAGMSNNPQLMSRMFKPDGTLLPKGSRVTMREFMEGQGVPPSVQRSSEDIFGPTRRSWMSSPNQQRLAGEAADEVNRGLRNLETTRVLGQRSGDVAQIGAAATSTQAQRGIIRSFLQMLRGDISGGMSDLASVRLAPASQAKQFLRRDGTNATMVQRRAAENAIRRRAGEGDSFFDRLGIVREFRNQNPAFRGRVNEAVQERIGAINSLDRMMPGFGASKSGLVRNPVSLGPRMGMSARSTEEFLDYIMRGMPYEASGRFGLQGMGSGYTEEMGAW